MKVKLRPARTTDAGKIGDIICWFQNDTDWMPKLYTGAEFVAFGGEMIDRGWVTVAMAGPHGAVVGFIARDGEEVCALYVASKTLVKAKSKVTGVGRALLSDAKTRSNTLRVQVFENNASARRFYRRAGFAEVGQGDGSGNEENLPELSCLWKKDAKK